MSSDTNLYQVNRSDACIHHGGTRQAAPSVIVWHQPDHRSFDVVLRTLNHERKASYHYIIPREVGPIQRLVNPDLIAWHAGYSDFPEMLRPDGTTSRSLNAVSIGISLMGLLRDKPTQFQTDASIWLIRQLQGRYKRVFRHLGHKEVAPTRRQDPGWNMNLWRQQFDTVYIPR